MKVRGLSKDSNVLAQNSPHDWFNQSLSSLRATRQNHIQVKVALSDLKRGKAANYCEIVSKLAVVPDLITGRRRGMPWCRNLEARRHHKVDTPRADCVAHDEQCSIYDVQGVSEELSASLRSFS